jgi:hypothetical protein
MIDDIKKSFNSILYERTTSPFFGTLIISWVFWNWKIIYLTIFISEDKIQGNKIDYLTNNFSNAHHLITYPLISTVLLITIVPFISNGAFWLSLKFNKWKKDQKNIVEMKQLLTLEQSIELREQISEQENRFEKLLESKNSEIENLNIIIENMNKERSMIDNKITPTFLGNKIEEHDDELIDLYHRIKNNEKELLEYNNVVYHIQRGYKMNGHDAPNSNFISLLESYDIIENFGNADFKFSDKGKQFNKLMIGNK